MNVVSSLNILHVLLKHVKNDERQVNDMNCRLTGNSYCRLVSQETWSLLITEEKVPQFEAIMLNFAPWPHQHEKQSSNQTCLKPLVKEWKTPILTGSECLHNY